MSSSRTKLIFLRLSICGGWEGTQAKCSVSTGEHNECSLLSEGTEIAKKALSKRAWCVQGGAHLESGVHRLEGGDSKEGWQDTLGCQGFGHQARWFGADLGKGLQMCAPSRADVCLKEPLGRGKVRGGRSEVGGGAVSSGLLRPCKALRSKVGSHDLCQRDQVCSADSSDILNSGAAWILWLHS